ncbi:MAG: NnrS family protein [bacterium]|nr:NnrS family protein [bacterium]
MPPPHIRNRRDYTGPLYLKQGFRPFFLGAAVWSAFAMAIWVSFLLYGDSLSLLGYFSAQDWHIHEMLFGFLPAAVAGFLLTAVPNWTGRLPVRGAPLALLAGMWLAGRLAILISGLIPEHIFGIVAVIDSLFLVSFAMLLAREIIAGKNTKNLPVVAIVSALAASNITFHMAALEIIPIVSTRQVALLAIYLVVLLVTLIGGRVVPSFTRNWMARNNVTPLPAPRDGVDQLGSLLIPFAALLLLALPQSRLTGLFCVFTALLHLYRLARWQGFATISEPLVVILHIGYGWIGIGFLLAGISILTSNIPFVAALHAFTAGMIGTMVLAIMTRASRGHTNQSLEADTGTTAIYILVSSSALIRVVSAIWGNPPWGYSLSGLLWIAAFSLFAILYFPFFVKR